MLGESRNNVTNKGKKRERRKQNKLNTGDR